MKIFDKRLYDNGKNVVLTVVVNLLDICNYDCVYCYNKRPRTKKALDANALCQFILQLKQYCKKKIELLILGGEPTLHKDLDQICKNLATEDNSICCRIFSNFSASIEYYIKLFQLENTAFNFTYHYNKADAHIYFVNKIKQIPYKYFVDDKIEIVIMYEHNYINQSLYVFDQLAGEYAKYINFTFVQDPGTSIGNYNYVYTDEQLRQYEIRGYDADYVKLRSHDVLTIVDKDKQQDLISTKFDDPTVVNTNFCNWQCNAGIDQLYIHFNGDISPCEDLYMQRKKILGNIYASNFNFNKMRWQICPLQTCPCPYFSMKQKIFKHR